MNDRPYVGGLQDSDMMVATLPLVHLYVSEDRLVLRPRFGLARLWRLWVIDRTDVATMEPTGTRSVHSRDRRVLR